MSSENAHPRGLPYIIGNEVAERFSYYGMKAILVVFMTTMLLDASGSPAPMSEQDATFWYHIFGMTNYFLPIFGAIAADLFLGKYRTIILLSLVYCAGHAALAIDDTRRGLVVGLALIAIGSGGIKPCVSAHLGDQYRYHGSSRISDGYSFFYLAINIGAFFSTLLTPWLLQRYGPQVAFALPGVFMGVATFVFWLGRNRYVALPPTPWAEYRAAICSSDGRRVISSLAVLFVALSIFWSLFDQTGSSWVLQAERMNRRVPLLFGASIELLPSQIQACNPILILVLTPLFTMLVYPKLNSLGLLSTKRKVIAGLLCASFSFAIIAFAQWRIVAGEVTSVGWQLLAYFVLTVSEVLVSITALELAYTHAPNASKSFITSFYLLSISLGNGVTALTTAMSAHLGHSPDTPMYFVVFSCLALFSLGPASWSFNRLKRAQG